MRIPSGILTLYYLLMDDLPRDVIDIIISQVGYVKQLRELYETHRQCAFYAMGRY